MSNRVGAVEGESVVSRPLNISNAYTEVRNAIGRHGGFDDACGDMSDAIALNAYWLRTIKQSYDQESHQAIVPNVSVARFLGFVEGRSRIIAPQWWADKVAQYGRRSRTIEGDVVYGNPTEISVIEEADGLWLRGSTPKQIRLEASKAILGDGLLATAVDQSHIVMCRLSWGSYPIACFERDSGKRVWESVVWVGATDPSGMGYQHSAQLVLSDGRVMVFGGGTVCYLQAFDTKDGKTISWWTSQLEAYYIDDIQKNIRKRGS